MVPTTGSPTPGGTPSPDLLGVLALLDLGRGAVLLVSGGTTYTRREHLRALEEAFQGRGMRTERLTASPSNHEVPYGTLLPWLSRWVAERSPRPEEGSKSRRTGSPARAKSESEAPLPMVALVGLFAPSGSSSPGSFPSLAMPAVGPEGPAPGPSLHVEPEDVRLALLELVTGKTHERPTLVVIERAEHLDGMSHEWLRRLAPELEHLPFILALAFDREGPEVAEWAQPTGAPTLPVWRRLPPPPSDVRLPSVRSLPLESRRLLLAALMAEEDADASLLAEVVGLPLPAVRERLRALKGQGRIEERDAAWAPVDPGTLEEDLRDMGPSTSVELHRAIARALESRYPHPQGGVQFRLAHHWAEAGALEKAMPYLQAVASECERWGAPELGAARLQRALVLAQREPSARGRELEELVLSQLGSLLYRAEDPAGAVAALRKALEMSRGRGASARVWGAYVARISNAQVRLGEDPERELRATLEKVRGLHPGVEAALLRSLASCMLARGRPEEAIEAAERACALAEKGSDPVLAVRARITAATCYLFGGRDLERPREHLLHALEMKEKVKGSPEETIVVDALDQLGLIELNRGNFAEAHRRGEEALLEARRLGSRTTLLGTLGNSAEYACAAGAWTRAEEIASEMRRLCDRYGTPDSDDTSLQLLLVESMIAEARGDVTAALGKLKKLQSDSEKGGIRYFAAQGILQEALVLERAGDANAARRAVRRLRHEGMVKALGTGNLRELEELERKLGGP